jgi:endonuclease/exonuclease/phosphatase family metal-dependent hydrolase
MRQRMAALGELIASYDPDLVALQEVTAEINSVLLDQVRFISFWQLL